MLTPPPLVTGCADRPWLPPPPHPSHPTSDKCCPHPRPLTSHQRQVLQTNTHRCRRWRRQVMETRGGRHWGVATTATSDGDPAFCFWKQAQFLLLTPSFFCWNSLFFCYHVFCFLPEPTSSRHGEKASTLGRKSFNRLEEKLQVP
ncbi:hypothetical protein VPH35_035569 [Triticum aestivum]